MTDDDIADAMRHEEAQLRQRISIEAGSNLSVQDACVNILGAMVYLHGASRSEWTDAQLQTAAAYRALYMREEGGQR